jgi:hypothetical protein
MRARHAKMPWLEPCDILHRVLAIRYFFVYEKKESDSQLAVVDHLYLTHLFQVDSTIYQVRCYFCMH